jgi:two-component system OmpR family response regulator
MPNNGKSGGPSRQRILIVDDEHFATHVLGRLLRRHGYIAAEVNDSTKALQVARRFRPDAALLDLHMPWKNGYEVAADFSADKLLCTVPIIFITADALTQKQSTKSAPVLVKPFSIEDLLACVKEGVASKGAESPDTPEKEIEQESFAESGIR